MVRTFILAAALAGLAATGPARELLASWTVDGRVRLTETLASWLGSGAVPG